MDSIIKINNPVDRTLWSMTPPTVNAGYNLLNNDISFPALVLQSPFFNPDADDAINYARKEAEPLTRYPR